MLRILVSLLLSGNLVPVGAQSGSFPGKIDCYSFTGRTFENNTQCPGSNICCQTADGCNNDRFCLANGQIIVPACSAFPWSNCANICQYDPGTGFLPRALNCTDGSFCCDNDPTCCAENRGVVLNGLGAIVSTDPGIVSTSSSSPTSSASTVVITSESRSQTPAGNSATATSTSGANLGQSTPPSTSMSTGEKAGIAVGVVVGVIIAICIAFFLVRRRRAHKTQRMVPNPHHVSGDNSELPGVPVRSPNNPDGWDGHNGFLPTSKWGQMHKSGQLPPSQDVYEMSN